MNKPDAEVKSANLDQNMESLLTENQFCFFRQISRDGHHTIFNIVCEPYGKDLLEQRITAYLHDNLIFFEAAVPVMHTNEDAVVKLVNDLNLAHPFGTFQLDLSDGELNWTTYAAANKGIWPGDTVVLSMLESAKEMAKILFQGLISVGDAPNGKE